jgi:hypothetical protein
MYNHRSKSRSSKPARATTVHYRRVNAARSTQHAARSTQHAARSTQLGGQQRFAPRAHNLQQRKQHRFFSSHTTCNSVSSSTQHAAQK